jgi:hypothetical protein
MGIWHSFPGLNENHNLDCRCWRYDYTAEMTNSDTATAGAGIGSDIKLRVCLNLVTMASSAGSDINHGASWLAGAKRLSQQMACGSAAVCDLQHVSSIKQSPCRTAPRASAIVTACHSPFCAHIELCHGGSSGIAIPVILDDHESKDRVFRRGRWP